MGPGFLNGPSVPPMQLTPQFLGWVIVGKQPSAFSTLTRDPGGQGDSGRRFTPLPFTTTLTCSPGLQTVATPPPRPGGHLHHLFPREGLGEGTGELVGDE